MAVDVPIALLGYGTVGAAVNRLLIESAADIERATGHRLRVVKALVRDPGKERDYPPVGRGAHRRLRGDRRRPVDRGRRRGDGRARAGRRLRARAAAARSPRRHREQAARRAARRRALRRGLVGRGAVAVRGECLCRDPRDQGAARVARRDERAPGARHRQRHDQLHAHRDGGGKQLRRGARRGAGARVRRGRSHRRRVGRRCGREDGDPRDGRVQLPGRPRRRRLLGNRRDRSARRRRGTRARHGDPPRRHRAARRRIVRRPGPARARRQAAPARQGRRRVQRGDAAGRRDPRDHARRPRRRRHRDGLGGGRGHHERARHDGHGLPAERRRMARAAEARRRARAARRSTSGSRSRIVPARWRASPRSWQSARSRSRGSSSMPNGSGAALHVVTHEARAGSLSDALEALGALPEVHQRSLPLPVVSDRGVAELGWA